MKYNELTVILPCHSLEDFPVHHTGDEAQGLLSAWTALWHPALLHSSRRMPAWRRAEELLDTLDGKLIVAPPVSESEFPPDFVERAEREGAVLIRGEISREKIVERALAPLDPVPIEVDPDLVADFLALGFCFLQVELLTRQMRYTSSLDETLFESRLLDALRATYGESSTDPKAETDSPTTEDSPEQGEQLALRTAHEELQSCFDLLSEERDHYYPVDTFLLDLTLVADTTIGESLRAELKREGPINLVLSGEVLATIAEKEPATLAALKEAVAEGKAAIIGGEFRERKLPQRLPESLLFELRKGHETYARQLGKPVEVFGRRRHGLTPGIPQVAESMGMKAAIHGGFDAGRIPEGPQARTRWEGWDLSDLDTVAKMPLDAAAPESYLNLPTKLGETMDTDHVATIVFARWPGQFCPWMEDLRRTARFVPALGKMLSVADYFSETDYTGQVDRFVVDQYRSPYLRQSVSGKEPDPITSTRQYLVRRAKADTAAAFSTMVAVATGKPGNDTSELVAEVEIADEQLAHAGVEHDAQTALDAHLDEAIDQAATLVSQQIPRSEKPEQPGLLVLNPYSFARRVGLDASSLPSLPDVEKPVVAVGESEGRKHVVLDVPPMGFAWAPAGKGRGMPRKLKKPLAEENTLRNEFMEARINETTGALQAVYDYKSRGNRVSQQLAFRGNDIGPEDTGRFAEPEQSGKYSIMAADSVEVTASSAAYAEITATGRLVSKDGDILARFKQIYQLYRASRVLNIDIELDPQREPEGDPWASYFAARFAWPDESANLYRGVQLTRQATTAKQLEAPHFVSVEAPDQSTLFLTGGLPYHRRIGLRMMDTILISRGESARRFQLGIGIDVTHPLREAITQFSDPIVLSQTAAPPTAGDSTWLFHIDARNVIATHWAPLVEEGAVVGYQVRLLETMGRGTKLGVRSFRPISTAKTVSFLGESPTEVETAGDVAKLKLEAYQWKQLEVRW
jgi:alpha-mannosidase